MPNPIFKSKIISLELKARNKVICRFKSKSVAKLFIKMDFFSRLLHGLKPDANGVWRKTPRLPYEIVGWPKDFAWKLTSDKEVESITSLSSEELEEYGKLLDRVLQDLINKDESGRYTFSISDIETGSTLEYKFYGRAREIAVLSILYDLEPHSRDHLEINIAEKYTDKEGGGDNEVRYYGDPSKTADVLRNEGWSREGNQQHMLVFRENVRGQQQQMYKIDTREQTLAQQVQRTAIKPAWRKELYERDNHTCKICLNKYPKEQLSPDHRVPVIFEADNLNDDNFKEKLMTLCRYCNQQKREFCKRVGVNYNWRTSPWAYPEDFLFERIKMSIKEYAEQNSIGTKKVVGLLVKEFED